MKKTPKTLTIVTCAIALLALSVLLLRAQQGPFLFPEERDFLQSVQDHFADGFARIEDIYPQDGWDAVCIVPAYSFGMLFPDSDKKKYMGADYSYNWLTSPDPMSMFFGLGFSFLDKDRLVNFIRIPAAHVTFADEGVLSPLSMQLSALSSPAVLHFSGMNVTYQRSDTPCYPRATAFIEYKDVQHIYVGG